MAVKFVLNAAVKDESAVELQRPSELRDLSFVVLDPLADSSGIAR